MFHSFETCDLYTEKENHTYTHIHIVTHKIYHFRQGYLLFPCKLFRPQIVLFDFKSTNWSSDSQFTTHTHWRGNRCCLLL